MAIVMGKNIELFLYYIEPNKDYFVCHDRKTSGLLGLVKLGRNSNRGSLKIMVWLLPKEDLNGCSYQKWCNLKNCLRKTKKRRDWVKPQFVSYCWPVVLDI